VDNGSHVASGYHAPDGSHLPDGDQGAAGSHHDLGYQRFDGFTLDQSAALTAFRAGQPGGGS